MRVAKLPQRTVITAIQKMMISSTETKFPLSQTQLLTPVDRLLRKLSAAANVTVDTSVSANKVSVQFLALFLAGEHAALAFLSSLQPSGSESLFLFLFPVSPHVEC